MHARYRYRIEPTGPQRAMLARTFGCVRVVFNDAISTREQAWNAGEKLSKTDVQRRVITEGKRTEARGWLAEVASVPPVQSIQDAHKAYQNFFDCCSGTRTGKRVGKPPVQVPHGQPAVIPAHQQRIQPPQQREAVPRADRERAGALVPRPTQHPTSGHDHQGTGRALRRQLRRGTRAPQPLPETDRETGADLGINRLATCADTDDNRTDRPKPKHLQRSQRKLRRTQREKSRRQKGSSNREKPRHKEATQHSKVSRCRRDYHHKQALHLVRENHVIHVKDLNVAGMVRNRKLARAISDAGWGQFVSLIEEKAEFYGRAVMKVDRWFPSSKMRSACGVLLEALPLRMRE